MKSLVNIDRRFVALGHDLTMAAVSYVLSLYLRLGAAMVELPVSILVHGLILFVVICAVAFWTRGLYRGVWRYASLSDMRAIAEAVTLAVLVLTVAMFLWTRAEALPRSLPVINWFVLALLLAGPRVIYRLFKDRRLTHLLERDGMARVPVLLVGAGDGAEAFIREMARDPAAGYRVVGVIDEKGKRIGRVIRGVEVLGGLDDVAEVVDRLDRLGRKPRRLIITKSRIEGAQVRRLLDTATGLGLTLARLPRLTDFKAEDGGRLEIRPIAIEDLLRRPQAVLDRESMAALITGRRVLITGAGGTIGAELSRQIAALEPAHLALLENAEAALYAIDLETAEAHPGLSRSTLIADIRDRARLDQVIAGERPELVFHAAALKHVPMIEANPAEGVLTNTVGTRNLAEACRAGGVHAVVMISTDKAVNPVSVMGATKRLAESYCQALDVIGRADRHGCRFVTVRFGNVLGSSGSVVPLFQRQLAAGGPLTVTHPEAKRYFMTVREAVELVLQASALGVRDPAAGGKIYVLDMGKPVRIADLARQIIWLAGLEPDRDVEITYIGLRPGERLSESLLHEHEAPLPTAFNGILLAAPRTTDYGLLSRAIDELAALALAGRSAEAVALLRRVVPEYRPAGGRPEPAAASG
ncbi:MAG: polysaccharide biosynthesis protein [Kiloniellales bacterium]